MLAMCQAISLDENFANENLLVGALRKRFESGRTNTNTNASTNGGRLLLLLLLLRVNGLECTGRDVDSLVQCAHALTTAGVTTVVTSRRHLQLPHCLEVPPLTPDDALQLLRHHAPEVNVTAYADLVKRHCHGLPPLVARMARLVSGHGDFALSPAELSQVRHRWMPSSSMSFVKMSMCLVNESMSCMLKSKVSLRVTLGFRDISFCACNACLQ